jgi:hypothetical protein
MKFLTLFILALFLFAAGSPVEAEKIKSSETRQDYNLKGKVKRMVEIAYDAKEVDGKWVKAEKEGFKKEFQFDQKGRLRKIIHHFSNDNIEEIYNYDDSGNYVGYVYYASPGEIMYKTTADVFDKDGRVVKEKCYDDKGKKAGELFHLYVNGVMVEKIRYAEPYICVERTSYNYVYYEKELVRDFYTLAYGNFGGIIDVYTEDFSFDREKNWIRGFRESSSRHGQRESVSRYIVERNIEYYQ